MNFINVLNTAAVMYCGAALLMNINAQPTTDDEVDKAEVAQLRAELVESVDRIVKLEDQLSTAVETVEQLKSQLVSLSYDGHRPTAASVMQGIM